jgi:hypothetical protein
MKNPKVIVVNGISRGGTNILWNMIQSHPAACGAMHETSRIFAPGMRHNLRFVGDFVLKQPALRVPPLLNIAGRLIDNRIYHFKLQNYLDSFNGYKAEGDAYTLEEVRQSAVVLKSINRTIYATPLFARIYGPRAYFVAIVRDGYGICESWVRRGIPADKTGRQYRQFVETMLRYAEQYPRYMMVKFEDILDQPFEVLERVFHFLELEPPAVEKFRLKSKAVLTEDGKHEAPYGHKGAKYWLDRDTICDFLVEDIADIQKRALSPETIAAFEREAMPALQALGYAP